MKRCIWCLLLTAILVCAAATQASADERIRVSGITPFVYNDYAYVPVRPTCDYIRADLTWDPYANSATVFYRNRNLTLVVGTTQAYYGDEIVALPAPVAIVRDQLCCPAEAFSRYLDVGLRWESNRHRAYFEGPPGWGYYDVDPICPPYALGVFASYGYVPVQPTPFLYGGVAFLPLRNVADLIGAALLFDLFNDRCVATYGGVQTVLFIGSPRCYYGDRVIVLPAAPIVCNNVVYVPAPLFENYWRVPVRREHGVFGLRGDRGWHDFNFAPAPRAPVYRSMTRAPLLRTAASGLRSTGITVPVEPGLLSLAAHGTAARRAGAAPARTARARRGPGTGFPALAAAPPRAGVSVLGPSAKQPGRPSAPPAPAAAPRAGRGPQPGAVAIPRGAKQRGGAAAAPPSGGKGRPQVGPAAAPPGGGKKKAGAAAPPSGGKQKGGAVVAPPGAGKPKAGPAAAPSGRAPQAGAAAAPRGGGKAQGGPAAAPRGRGRGPQGAKAAPQPGAAKAKAGPSAAPPGAGRGRGQSGAAAAPHGGGGQPRGGGRQERGRGGGG
jgi:hypothetical protein